MLGLLRSQSNCDLSRKLRSPACCYRERSKPPYVSYCYGITWDDVRILEEDGKVPAVAHPMAAGRPIEREWGTAVVNGKANQVAAHVSVASGVRVHCRP